MRRGDRTAVIPARADHRPLIKHITVATQIQLVNLDDNTWSTIYCLIEGA